MGKLYLKYCNRCKRETAHEWRKEPESIQEELQFEEVCLICEGTCLNLGTLEALDPK